MGEDASSRLGDAGNEKQQYAHVFPTNISDVPHPAAPEDLSDKSPTRSPSREIHEDPEKDPEKYLDLEAGPHGSSATSDTVIETTAVGAADAVEEPPNPNSVDWDGPDDPHKAINWTSKRKWSNIAVISSITFLTPLASSMFAPGVQEVMSEFKSTNEELASFVVSIYVMGFAFGPLIIAPCSELYGRLPVYHTCNCLFVIFTIACAAANNLSSLIVFRFFEGCAGSAPLSIGGGSLADMIIQEKRGAAMAIWALGPLLGPVIGPVAGGYLSQAAGWRWVFWAIAIAAGVITCSAFVFLRETYPPTLLERKVKRLRKETGNENLYSAMSSGLKPRQLFIRSIIRPSKMLFFSPVVLALSIYMGVAYGYMYLLFTTITPVFESQYHFSQGSVGLTFLGIGIGSLGGLAIFGFLSDYILKRMSAKGEMKPEYRLPPLAPGAFLIPIGLFWYGWSAQAKIHWIMPIIGTMWVGLGLMATFMPINTYLVDAFTLHAASALAASTVIRSLMGAVLPLAGRRMYQVLGLGWGNSLLAFLALAFSPLPFVLLKYGERIRKSKRFQLNL